MLKDRTETLILLCVLFTSFLLKLNHLGHRSFQGIDECCHALVSKNLLKHPLKPTLIDVPYIPYFEDTWGRNHVWLHKPILPMWQSAVSMALVGITPFAVRLPSAILSTLAVWLTYLIGVELLTKRSALIAATAQAFSWFIMRLVHGYLFSDMMDISLLFYCELGIYGVIRTVKTGEWRYVLLAGVGQGLAFLSKTYPAFIVTGVALTAWLAPVLSLAKKEDCHYRWQHVLGLLGVTVLVAGPWTLYTAIEYPIEFEISNRVTFSHFTENLQGWGAPWYQVFIYNMHLFSSLTLPTLIATFYFLPRLFRQKDVGICLLYAWGLGVFPPFLIAISKIPTATLMGAPALLLLLGRFVEDTTRKKKEVPRWKPIYRYIWTFFIAFLFLIQAINAWWLTETNANDRTYSDIASYAENHLPPNAVLLTEIIYTDAQNDDNHLRIMFLTSHTAHPYTTANGWEKLVSQAQRHGGIPYIVTFRELDLPVVFKSEMDKTTIYATVPHRISNPDENHNSLR